MKMIKLNLVACVLLLAYSISSPIEVLAQDKVVVVVLGSDGEVSTEQATQGGLDPAASGETPTVSASCPTGTKLISGGFEEDGGVVAKDAAPNFDQNSFEVRMGEQPGNDLSNNSVTAYAICFRG